LLSSPRLQNSKESLNSLILFSGHVNTFQKILAKDIYFSQPQGEEEENIASSNLLSGGSG